MLPLLTAAVILAAGALIPQIGRAGTFTAPQGCMLELTVQNRGCSVSQYYRCSADAEGDQRSATFSADGLRYQSRIDVETRWVESLDPVSGVEDRLVDQAKDHASFSTLLQSGMDDFDFWTQSSTGEQLHHIGQDKLTGKKVTIDGVELEETRFQMKTLNTAGEVLIERSGQQYISRETGRFYGGIERSSDWTGQRQETNDSPVTFSFPDDEGFGETTPLYDCDEMLAQVPLTRKAF